MEGAMGLPVSGTTEDGVRMLESRCRPASGRRLTSGEAGAVASSAGDLDSAAVILPEVLPPQSRDGREQPMRTRSALAVTFAPGSASLGIESVAIAVGVRMCGALSLTENASPRSVFLGNQPVAVSATCQDRIFQSASKVSFTDDGCYVVFPHTARERLKSSGSRLRRSA